MNLFQYGDYKLHSGLISQYKIDCDALSDLDWQTLAYMLSEYLKDFGKVEGVPRGGIPLAQALQKYANLNSKKLLIVDDVWTTGSTMREFRQRINPNAMGAVIFARAKVDDWVFPLFRMPNG